MSDVAGLVEKLSLKSDPESRDAASALQAQAAEIQALAMDALTAQGQAWENHDRAKAAEAKLREAVEVMRALADLFEDADKTDAEAFREMERRIRAFLATMEKPDD